MDDTEREELLAALHDHLEATEDLAIHHAANRWLGEAEAVAADLVGEEVPEAVVRKRVAQVRELLEAIDETENPEADEHVAAALRIADAIDDRL